jgi:hypothetical protein
MAMGYISFAVEIVGGEGVAVDARGCIGLSGC